MKKKWKKTPNYYIWSYKEFKIVFASTDKIFYLYDLEMGPDCNCLGKFPSLKYAKILAENL